MTATPHRPTLVEHVRALIPPFFGRFFDTDLAPGSNELRQSVIQLVAFLAMPGFVAPFFMAFAFNQHIPGPEGMGWNLLAIREGVDALRIAAFRDKALYLGASMAASGLIGAITWSSLLVSRRDVLVLGAMPVRATAIVTAKLIALAAFAAMLAASMHAFAAVSFGTFLAAENTGLFLARGVVAHFVASFGVSVFVVFALAAAQGLAMSVLGPRRFERLSPILQMLLVGCVIAMLILLPGASRGAYASLEALAGANLWQLVLGGPLLWFLGIYETVLGTGSGTLHALASVALAMFAAVTALLVVTFAMSYQRLMLEALSVPAGSRRLGRVTGFAARLTSRDLDVRTIAEFFLNTIARVPRHRFVVASALGVGLAWGLPGWLTLAENASVPSAAAITIPYSLVFFLTIGVRIAASLPSDLGASWLFDYSLLHWRPVRTAVERTMLVVCLAPVLLLSTMAIAASWGAKEAIVHAAMLGTTGAFLIQLMLLRFRGVPCLGQWSPGGLKLRVLWPLYLLAISTVTLGLPATEWRLLDGGPLVGFYSLVLGVGALATRAQSIRLAGARVLADHLVIFPEGHPVSRQEPTGDIDLLTSSNASRPAVAFAAFTRLGWQDRLLAVGIWLRDLRPRNWWPGWEMLRRDVRAAMRTARARPVLSAISAITIAVGVAATATVYALLHAVLLKPADIADIDRVVNIYDVYPFGGASAPNMMMSWQELSDLRERQTVFSEVAGWRSLDEPLTVGGIERQVFGESVTADYFALVQPPLAFGRGIGAHDETTSARVVVLSHRIWQAEFGADPAILGKSVRIGQAGFEVVGVTEPSFRGVAMPNVRSTELWVPIAATPRWAEDGAETRLMVKARLRTGVSFEEAGSEIGRLAARLDRESPLDRDPRYRRRWWISPAADVKLLEPFTRIAIPITWLLMGAATLLLAATCSSLATITFARHIARRRDHAVRLALGASPVELVRAHLVEAAFVVIAGGLGAWLITRVAVLSIAGASVRLAPGFVGHMRPEFDAGVWAVIGCSLALALLVIGVWPGWRLMRRAARGGLAVSSTHTLSSWRSERTLVALQVATAVVFLSTTMIFGGELARRVWHDPGMSLERVAVVRMVPPQRSEDVASQMASVNALRRGLNNERQVQVTALAANLPTGTGILPTISLEASGATVDDVPAVYADSSIFRALDIPFRAGGWYANAAGRAEIVLAETAARQIFGSATAVGQFVVVRRPGRTNERARTMIVSGVTRDTDVGVVGRAGSLAFLPLEEATDRPSMLVFRASTSEANLERHLPDLIRRYTPELRIRESVSGLVAAGADSAVDRMFAAVAGVLGLAALLLAMLGLSGVLLQHVTERTKDIGIRSALGATGRAIVRMVVADGARATATGFAIGAFATWTLWSIARAMLTTLVPTVVWPALLIVPVVLGIATLLACYLPAKHATTVDAIRAIRD